MLTRWAPVLLFLLLLLAAPLHAHGGSYRGPSFPTGSRTPGGSTPGPGAGGGTNTTQSLDLRRWETWWVLNKEDFFPARGVKRIVTWSADGSYDVIGPRSPNATELRSVAIPALLDLLKSEKDATIRDAACVALGKIGGDPEVDVLRGLLSDKERSVREGSILGLGLLREARSEEHLIALVKDTGRPGRERGLAIAALGLSGQAKAQEFLTEGFAATKMIARGRGSDLESIRAVAIGLLGQNDLLPPTAPPRETRFTANLIAAIRKDAVSESDFLAHAYVGLAKARDQNAWLQVRDGLRHSKSNVRAGAAIAAGRTLYQPEKERVNELKSLLDNEGDSYAKRMLVASIGRMGGAEAKRLLGQVIGDKDRQIRAFAALALGMAQGKEHADAFRAELKGAGDGREAAAYAIGLALMADTASIPLIVAEIERRKDPQVQALLVQALIVMQEPSVVPTVEALLLDTKNPDVQAACGLALGLLGDDKSAGTLLQILEGSGTLTVRAAVAAGLGRRGDKSLLEPLLAFAKNESHPDAARAFAVAAIGILGDKSPALPPFSRASIDGHYGVRNEVLEELRDLL